MEPLKIRLAAVLVTFAVLAGASPAWALGTAANTSIDNRASVTYTVSTVPQTLIESAPGGNSNPAGSVMKVPLPETNSSINAPD